MNDFSLGKLEMKSWHSWDNSCPTNNFEDDIFIFLYLHNLASLVLVLLMAVDRVYRVIKCWQLARSVQ